MSDDFHNVPKFDDLPSVEGMPHGCAWGIFDRNGVKDHLGCLNHLTPSVVREAYKEARDGVSVSLDWPINAIAKPGYMRQPLVHKVIAFKEDTHLDLHMFDDELYFNTQASSQWDSLVHFAHQSSGLGYNGCRATRDSLMQPFGKHDEAKALPTLNHWHERGGLVGRGVLLDYRAYAAAHGIEYSCFDNHPITVEDLDAVAKFQKTHLKHGDILLIRTGYTEDIDITNEAQQAEVLGTHKMVGVVASQDSARWFWDHHFSAVAGDSPAFEVFPPLAADSKDKEAGTKDLSTFNESPDLLPN